MVVKIKTAKATVEPSFPYSSDARMWAKWFIEHKKINNWTLEDINEELMLSWFGSAIEYAKNEALLHRP